MLLTSTQKCHLMSHALDGGNSQGTAEFGNLCVLEIPFSVGPYLLLLLQRGTKMSLSSSSSSFCLRCGEICHRALSLLSQRTEPQKVLNTSLHLETKGVRKPREPSYNYRARKGAEANFVRLVDKDFAAKKFLFTAPPSVFLLLPLLHFERSADLTLAASTAPPPFA